jgi:long-subunit acyl-CoA synthetase (AMP-forming)
VDDRLILDHVRAHAARRPAQVLLTQPVGGGQVVDYTWAEVLDQAQRMAAHLQALGLPRGARVAILSKNCAHFVIAELAVWIGGYATVAIYPTDTAETVRYVLEHSEAGALFVGKLDLWPQQSAGVPAGLPCIALPLAPPTPHPRWDDLVARTAPLASAPARAPDELAMLIYTSGSTGTPKGAMVRFDAFSRAAAGIVADLRARLGEADHRALSYLPLAHSFERSWGEGAALVDGRVRLYFAESIDTFLADLRRARPTLFMSVPRLWLKFQLGVHAKLPPARLDRLLAVPLLGRLVARRVLAGLGLDAVRIAGSGSAPLPAELLRWYRRLGLNLYEGYGMTEDNSYSHSSREGSSEPGWVGVPLPGVEVRIADDGEVLIKSPGQFSGYYKQPELSAESFTADGYFRTGDLGERRADGLLRLTGRKKELFKTAKGKYVAPAPIENLLNASGLVEACMVSGVGRAAPYALVVLAEALRARLADPAQRAAARIEVQQQLSKLLDRVNAKLPTHERLQMIVVAREPWTIDNGCLTPTMKIRRARIEQASAAEVEGWYAGGQRVVWA